LKERQDDPFQKELTMRCSLQRDLAVLAVAVLVGAALLVGATVKPAPKKPVGPGYTDTPFLPDGKWRVHDATRPHPPVIDPPTAGTQDEPGRPPSDAVVLFGGKEQDLSKWQAWSKGKVVPARWKVTGGYMEVTPKSGSISTKEKFGDCQLHVEWAAPAPARGSGQGRGNSGVLLMGCYEIQVMDSYKNLTYADGQAASLYGQYPPLVNACRKPGEWQTFDIIFEAPRFAGGKLVKPAYATVLHNGVLAHHRRQLIGQVAHKRVGRYRPHGPEGSLQLQNHGNPVRYRNVWIRRLTAGDPAAGKEARPAGTAAGT
jgi:hypothetical protein